MEAVKTAEERSQIQPKPGPSGGCGGHAEVESPKKKGRFDQKSPDGLTGELHVPPAVQPPIYAETYVIVDSEVD
jgi:hypothetical protein